MTRRALYAACLAGVAGAVSPVLLVVVWATLNTMRRLPMSRLTAFLDPSAAHRGLEASTLALELLVGALLGLAFSLLIARFLRRDRWLGCIVFLSAFAAVWVIPAAMHEGWARLPAVLAQPLLFGFVAAAMAGFYLAPRIAARRNVDPESPG